MDKSSAIPIPNWLKGVFAGLGVLILVIVVVVALWIYRVRKNVKANEASGEYAPVGDDSTGSLLDEGALGGINDGADDLEDLEFGAPSKASKSPFDVITNPNRVQGSSIHHHPDPDIDSDGLID